MVKVEPAPYASRSAKRVAASVNTVGGARAKISRDRVKLLTQLEDDLPWTSVLPSWTYKQKPFLRRLKDLSSGLVDGEQTNDPFILDAELRALCRELHAHIKPSQLAPWFSRGFRYWSQKLDQPDASSVSEAIEALRAAATGHAVPPASWPVDGATIKMESPMRVVQLAPALSEAKDDVKVKREAQPSVERSSRAGSSRAASNRAATRRVGPAAPEPCVSSKAAGKRRLSAPDPPPGPRASDQDLSDEEEVVAQSSAWSAVPDDYLTSLEGSSSMAGAMGEEPAGDAQIEEEVEEGEKAADEEDTEEEVMLVETEGDVVEGNHDGDDTGHGEHIEASSAAAKRPRGRPRKSAAAASSSTSSTALVVRPSGSVDSAHPVAMQPSVLEADWMQEEDAEEAENANGAAGQDQVSALNNVDFSSLDAHDKELEKQVREKESMTLRAVARHGLGSEAMKSFLAHEYDASTTVDPQVQARVKPAALPSLRVVQFRAFKALLKFKVKLDQQKKVTQWTVSQTARTDASYLRSKANNIAEKYIQPKPWIKGYLAGEPDVEASATSGSGKRCDRCNKGTNGSGMKFNAFGYEGPELFCATCWEQVWTRTTDVKPSCNSDSDDSDSDNLCDICCDYLSATYHSSTWDFYDVERGSTVCERCFKECAVSESEGKCAECKAATKEGAYHVSHPTHLLCPDCFTSKENVRKENLKYNPIGHCLEESSVKHIIRIALPTINAHKDRADVAISEMKKLTSFETLLTFLEQQLGAAFDAFKLSTAWQGFLISEADGARSLPTDTTEEAASKSMPLKQPDAKLASASASDAYAEYMPAKLTYGPPHVEHVVESASLACVAPTDVTFQPSLPEEALSSGVLSRVQLECVVYALQQHEKRLARGQRAGFFIGDGTGVGKGRELAAIIWDNWLKGRTKAVWFTCNTDLAVDARRDLDDIGATDVPLQSLTSLPAVGKIDDHFDEGVLVVTYSCLVARSSASSRYDQLMRWLEPTNSGQQFDGVLGFDEAHKAKGAAHDQPVGKAVVQLQSDLPNARVVYLSATGATQVKDMSYMIRLGLWGPGTCFRDFKAIESTLYQHNGGTDGVAGALEMFAVQLKSSGAYLARNLGLRGVDFHMEVAQLTEEQSKLYNKAADLWLDMWHGLRHLSSSGAVRNFEGAYTSAQVKFFQQLILSFKVPEIQRQTRKALRAGKCVVIGLQSTGDAAVKEFLARMGGKGGATKATTTSKLVSSASEAVRGLLETLEDGASSLRGFYGGPAAFDDWKQSILTALAELDLPASALDELIDYFGVDNVAEMTGRSHRLIRTQAADGSSQFTLKSRAERGVPLNKTNLMERARFQSGEKLIAILSDAGATGVSLHADKTQSNQRRRFHIVPELGWSAAKVVQQFGRTHRTNQLMPPEYCLLMCECASESLTGSAVARKLEGLGALTKGDKTAGRGETGGLGTNLETKVGIDALSRLHWIRNDRANGDRVYSLQGAPNVQSTPKQQDKLHNGALNSVKGFLTWLQLLPFDQQQSVLRIFISKIQQTDNAMASQLESRTVKVVSEKVVFQNSRNSAEKVTVTEIECDHSCTWEAALELLGDRVNAPLEELSGFFMRKDDPQKIPFLVLPVDATRVRVVYPQRFSGGMYDPMYIARNCLKFPSAALEHAQRAWQHAFAVAIATGGHIEKFALLNGSVFSIWYNVRKAMDPTFNPDEASSETLQAEMSGGRGGKSKYNFQPNVKIQLVTTSDGKKLGGIRLSVHKPLSHCSMGKWNDQCNKRQAYLRLKQGRYDQVSLRQAEQSARGVYCRKRKCMVEGHSEVDKLVLCLAMCTRTIAV